MARGTSPRSTSARRPASGKTFAMLNEGRRAHERGTDVVVGLRRDARAREHRRAARRPRGRARGGRSSTAASTFEEMDVDADPRPQARAWCSSTSSRTPTSRARATRSAGRTSTSCSTPGIDVISTVNIQHLESVNDVVEQITGRQAARDDPRRDRARGRPDRARRHDARGAAPPHGPRQHLHVREGRRGARQLLPAGQPRARCASSRCCGSPTGSTRRSRSTASATASPSRGRRASGSWSRSPARPAATT